MPSSLPASTSARYVSSGSADELGGDAEVRLELRLERSSASAAGIRDGGARRRRVVDRRHESGRVAGRGQGLLGERRVVVVPAAARARVRERARSGVGRQHRAGRQVRGDESVSVDPERQCAPDALVVERRERVADAEVDDLESVARRADRADVRVDRLDAGRRDVIDAVDRPGLEFVDPLAARPDPSGR